MKYMGSKDRHSKQLLPLLMKTYEEGMNYVEPFVGGGNMIDKIPNTIKRIGYDYNPNTIKALIFIRDYLESIPKNNSEFTENDYKNIKNSPSLLINSFAGFAYSYSGKWMGGWRRDSKGERDYVAESYRNAVKQNPLLQGVHLETRCFTDIVLENKSVIYCDPPYEGTTKYKNSFNHSLFWNWCREKVKEGHHVFISEYNCPDDFVCIWEKEVNSSLTKDTGSKKNVEKLFIHKSFLETYTKGNNI